jgi:hypothetical protein
MARHVPALGNPAGSSLLLGHGRAFIAAVLLVVFMSPQFGAAEEPGTPARGRRIFGEEQLLELRQEIGGIGLLQGGVLTHASPAQTWLSPRMERQDGNETHREPYGAQLAWDRILGSNLKLQYSLRSRDNTGPQGGADPALSNLAVDRRSSTHQGTAIYRFTLSEKHHLTPAFNVNYDDTEGEAGKGRAADVRLTYSYLGNPLVLVVDALIEHAGYDEKDPAFGKTGDDDSFGASASVYYTSPWGGSLFRSEAIRFFATGTYHYTDSKGDPSKQESVSGAAGISLEW